MTNSIKNLIQDYMDMTRYSKFQVEKGYKEKYTDWTEVRLSDEEIQQVHQNCYKDVIKGFMEIGFTRKAGTMEIVFSNKGETK